MQRDEFFWLSTINKATVVVNRAEGLIGDDTAKRAARGIRAGEAALPSTSKRRGKSRRDFLLCGPVCINTGIACLFSPKMKRTSERIVKFHSLA